MDFTELNIMSLFVIFPINIFQHSMTHQGVISRRKRATNVFRNKYFKVEHINFSNLKSKRGMTKIYV